MEFKMTKLLNDYKALSLNEAREAVCTDLELNIISIDILYDKYGAETIDELMGWN